MESRREGAGVRPEIHKAQGQSTAMPNLLQGSGQPCAPWHPACSTSGTWHVARTPQAWPHLTCLNRDTDHQWPLHPGLHHHCLIAAAGRHRSALGALDRGPRAHPSQGAITSLARAATRACTRSANCIAVSPGCCACGSRKYTSHTTAQLVMSLICARHHSPCECRTPPP